MQDKVWRSDEVSTPWFAGEVTVMFLGPSVSKVSTIKRRGREATVVHSPRRVFRFGYYRILWASVPGSILSLLRYACFNHCGTHLYDSVHDSITETLRAASSIFPCVLLRRKICGLDHDLTLAKKLLFINNLALRYIPAPISTIAPLNILQLRNPYV